jgi:putative transcriptional regulator
MNILPIHHPDEGLLYAYATGRVDLAVAYAVIAHLQFCPSCRSFVAALETIGGGVLADAEPQAVSMACLDRVMAALERVDTPEPFSAPLRFLNHSAVLGTECKINPKIRQIPVLAGETPIAALLEGGPGAVLPAHSHDAEEIVVILKGSYSDDAGRFGLGDFVVSEPGTAHQPIADSIEGCLCYIAHNLAA